MDIYEAIRQGLQIDLKLLRAGCEDETTWQQEYCCQFVSTAENFIPPALIALCTCAEATKDCPPQFLALAPPRGGNGRPLHAEPLGSRSSEFYLGIDIGRHHDRTVFWLDELQVSGSSPSRDTGAVQEVQADEHCQTSRHLAPAVTRPWCARLVEIPPLRSNSTFARELLSLRGPDGRPLVRRACIDSTGMGAPLAESLEREFGPRVEPVTFTSAVKEDMAYRVKRRMEQRLDLIPDAPEIARAFGAVKKLVTAAGNTRFDAERTDRGHADEFWAKALRRPGGGAADLTPERRCDRGEATGAAWLPACPGPGSEF